MDPATPTLPPLARVSIIVPVYNVEQFLPKCLDSLIGQTHSDIEVILIDDGSTDGSLDICKRYASKRDNWIVISKPNEGQGIARNIGIKTATGEYIIFVDSDDWIEKDLCQEVAQQLKASNADFANFGLDFVTPQGDVIKQIVKFRQQFLSGEQIFHRALIDSDVLSISWNKMYRKSIFENEQIVFPPIRANEDIYFSRAVSQSSKACIFIDRVFYHALVRPGSTSRSMSEEIYYATRELLRYEEQRFNLTNPLSRQLFDAHTVKLWSYLIVQGSFRIKDQVSFLKCYSIATSEQFLSRANSRSITHHLSWKNQIIIFLCLFPRTLRFLSKIANGLGINPY